MPGDESNVKVNRTASKLKNNIIIAIQYNFKDVYIRCVIFRSFSYLSIGYNVVSEYICLTSGNWMNEIKKTLLNELLLLKSCEVAYRMKGLSTWWNERNEASIMLLLCLLLFPIFTNNIV